MAGRGGWGSNASRGAGGVAGDPVRTWRQLAESGGDAGGEPAAKRRKGPALKVETKDAGGEGVQGLEILLGTYQQTTEKSGEQPVYEKACGIPGVQGSEESCFLYYWPPEDGEENNEGWWFGDSVGGSMVYCYAKRSGFPPPNSGWHIPVEGDPLIECLRVTVVADASGGSSTANPRVVPPKAMPPPQTPAPVARPPGRQPSEPPPGAGGSKGTGAAAAGGAVPGKGGAKGNQAAASSATPHIAGMRPPDPGTTLKFDFTAVMGPSLGVNFQEPSATEALPLILEVRPGTPAAQLGMPVNGRLWAVNGQALSGGSTTFQDAKKFLTSRPLTLEVIPPKDASASAALGKGGHRPPTPKATWARPQFGPVRPQSAAASTPRPPAAAAPQTFGRPPRPAAAAAVAAATGPAAASGKGGPMPPQTPPPSEVPAPPRDPPLPRGPPPAALLASAASRPAAGMRPAVPGFVNGTKGGGGGLGAPAGAPPPTAPPPTAPLPTAPMPRAPSQTAPSQVAPPRPMPPATAPATQQVQVQVPDTHRQAVALLGTFDSEDLDGLERLMLRLLGEKREAARNGGQRPCWKLAQQLGSGGYPK